jgi:hypothetical protein
MQDWAEKTSVTAGTRRDFRAGMVETPILIRLWRDHGVTCHYAHDGARARLRVSYQSTVILEEDAPNWLAACERAMALHEVAPLLAIRPVASQIN